MNIEPKTLYHVDLLLSEPLTNNCVLHGQVTLTRDNSGHITVEVETVVGVVATEVLKMFDVLKFLGANLSDLTYKLPANEVGHAVRLYTSLLKVVPQDVLRRAFEYEEESVAGIERKAAGEAAAAIKNMREG